MTMIAPQDSREPPHARTWQAIRLECTRRTGKDCGYPFCRCAPAWWSEEAARTLGLKEMAA